ncbi:hypothetical protein GCM10027186_60230 [Micromonospora schwarzwaldensis]
MSRTAPPVTTIATFAMIEVYASRRSRVGETGNRTERFTERILRTVVDPDRATPSPRWAESPDPGFAGPGRIT